MSTLGIPELMIAAFIALWGLVPLAAAVWAIVTLYRLRTNLDAIRATLERVERTLAQR